MSVLGGGGSGSQNCPEGQGALIACVSWGGVLMTINIKIVIVVVTVVYFPCEWTRKW